MVRPLVPTATTQTISDDLEVFWSGLTAHYSQLIPEGVSKDGAFTERKLALNQAVQQLLGGVSAGLGEVIEGRDAMGKRWSLATWVAAGIKAPIKAVEILAQGLAGLAGTGFYLLDVIPVGLQEWNRQWMAGEELDFGEIFAASKYSNDAALTVHALATLGKAAGLALLGSLAQPLDFRPQYRQFFKNPGTKTLPEIQAEVRAEDQRFFAEDLLGLDLQDPLHPNRLSNALALGLSFALGPKLFRSKAPVVAETSALEATVLKPPAQLKVVGGTGFGPRPVETLTRTGGGIAGGGEVVRLGQVRTLPGGVSNHNGLGTVAQAGGNIASGELAQVISLRQFVEGNVAVALEILPASDLIPTLQSPVPKLSLVKNFPEFRNPISEPSVLPILAIPGGEADPFRKHRENRLRQRHLINLENLKVLERLYGYQEGRLTQAYLQTHGLTEEDLLGRIGEDVLRANSKNEAGKGPDRPEADSEVTQPIGVNPTWGMEIIRLAREFDFDDPGFLEPLAAMPRHDQTVEKVREIFWAFYPETIDAPTSVRQALFKRVLTGRLGQQEAEKLANEISMDKVQLLPNGPEDYLLVPNRIVVRPSPALTDPLEAPTLIDVEPPQALVRRDRALAAGPQQDLVKKPLPDLLRNPRIVAYYPDGRLQVSIHGREDLTPQDLFEFIQLIFHQAEEFRGHLRAMQERGANIQALAAHVERIAQTLQDALEQLTSGRLPQARFRLEEVEVQVDTFQGAMRWVAGTVGLEIDPQTGRLRDEPVALRPPILPAALGARQGRILEPGRNEATAALPPDELDTMRSPAASSDAEPVNPRSPTDYFVVFSSRAWELDFKKHPVYSLVKHNNERNYSSYSMVPQPPKNFPTAQIIGSFSKTPQGIRFKPVSGASVDLSKAEQIKFSEGTIEVRGIAPLLMEAIGRDLQAASGVVGERTPELLRALGEAEKEIRSDDIEILRQMILCLTMIGIPFAPKVYTYTLPLDAVPQEDLAKIAAKLLAFYDPKLSDQGKRAYYLVRSLLPALARKAQLEAVRKILESHFSLPDEPDLRGRWGRDKHLGEILAEAGTEARLYALEQLTARLAGGEEVTQTHLNLLERLLGSFPREILQNKLKSAPSKSFQLLVKAYLGGLPWVKPIYELYRKAADPDAYLRRAVDRVTYFREGGLLFARSEDHLAFAYGALDNPEQLSFEQFKTQLRIQDLPKPFLPERFQVEVPIVRAVHAKIDKGVMQEAYQAIVENHTSQGLADYLQEVLGTPKPNGLAPFREELKGLPAPSAENAVQVAEQLLRLLAESGRPMPPQLKRVVARLVLGLASAGETGRRLLPSIANYHPKVSSEELAVVLQALREFFSEAVAEVVEPYPNLKLHSLEQMRKNLNRQAEGLQEQPEGSQLIEMIPSKSQTDAFAGYVGEDCTKSKWADEIKRADTQVVRMLADRRLVGMVYLKRAVLDGKVVLVVGIEPRARFRVSHPELLKALIKSLGTLAGKYDYDQILISTGHHQRSNRADMNDAIDKFFSGTAPTKFRQPVDGGIFSGTDFHVAWQRPQGLPKGPPPPEDLGRVVDSGSRTLLNGN